MTTLRLQLQVILTTLRPVDRIYKHISPVEINKHHRPVWCRLKVAPYFSSGIVERAKRERA